MPGRDSNDPSLLPVSVTYSSLRGFRYHSCRPDEYMIKSGAFIKTETISKKTYQWPFQRVTVITLAPRNYSFTLHCISKDLVPFDLPVVFTIGPYDPESSNEGRANFHKYASKMSAMTSKELHDVVLGCIHGQTRLYAAGLTVLEMFGDRDSFKMHVQERIGKELLSFGLQVFNGNVAEMKDSSGNAYFSSLKQKAISGATNDARVQVASAKRTGDIGEAENEAAAKVRLAEVSAKVQESQNEREQEIAKANLQLQLVKIQCATDEESQRVQSSMAPKRLEAELQTELNKLDGIKEQELLRATDLARKNVEAECWVKQAEAESQAQQLHADAQNVVNKQTAEAKAAAVRVMAEADKYAAQQKAEGIKATMEAQAQGIERLLSIADADLVKFYLALERGLFTELADKTASAVHGLQPKINVWSTGGGGGNGSEHAPLHSLFTSLPPMMDALAQQTNVKMPGWMPQTIPEASTVPPSANRSASPAKAAVVRDRTAVN